MVKVQTTNHFFITKTTTILFDLRDYLRLDEECSDELPCFFTAMEAKQLPNMTLIQPILYELE
jgi:hypothetical protein